MAKFNRLFIAEKGSVGKGLADYLSRTTGGKLESHSNYARVGDDIVTWMSGHLLEQVDAHDYDPRYKSWRLDDLPIIPQPFKLMVKTDARSNAQAKVDLIRKLLQDCTTVVGYGDPDAEGQLLQDELLIYLNNKKPVQRLWVNALDDATLAKGLANLRPNSDYIGWYEAALSRSQADWLYGINLTRACAIHARNAGADFMVTVGRVQTPTLALVVQRELEIRNFKPVDYHVPYIGLATVPGFRATWFTVKGEDGQYDDPRVDAEGRIIERKHADAIVAAARGAGKATVIVAETKAGTESAPLPFALSSLQAHCSRLFGLSAMQTLEVAQNLYLKKLATYPRVDCDYLPESQHADAPKVLASLMKANVPLAFGAALRGAKPGLKSRAWNDSKVTAHHAIIPAHLDNPADLNRMDDIERKVYFEIAKRYVLQFWPAAKFMDTEVVLACGTHGAEELYTARGKRYTDEGWRKAFAGDESDDEQPVTLPSLSKGQVLGLTEAGADSKRTQPPKRFTDGTLITAMKNVHQYVKNPDYKKRLKESVGIGTEATRPSIIENMLAKKFVRKDGKEFVPTESGMQLIAALPDSMKTPDMTAMWQQFNDNVMARTSTHKDFINSMVPWVTKMVQLSAGFFRPEQFPNAKPRAVETAFTCFGSVGLPGCGAPLRAIPGKYGTFFGCTSDACRKTFRDVGGNPVEKGAEVEQAGGARYACPQCKEGALRLVERKDKSGHFWGCGRWREGCKAIFNDLEGAPDFEGKTRGGGGGGGGGGAPRSSSRGHGGRPSSYQTPTPMPR